MTRLIAIGVTLMVLGACETAKGAGKDIEKAGGAIAEAAKDVQDSF